MYRGRILGRERKDSRAKSREPTLMGATTAESRRVTKWDVWSLYFLPRRKWSGAGVGRIKVWTRAAFGSW